MEEMIKLSILCIAASLLTVIVGENSRTMGTLVTLTGAAVLFGFIFERLQTVIGHTVGLLTAAEIDMELLQPVLKVMGVALCGRVTAAICRDMGSQWAACSVEIFTVLSGMLCALPLLRNVLQLVGSI